MSDGIVMSDANLQAMSAMINGDAAPGAPIVRDSGSK